MFIGTQPAIGLAAVPQVGTPCALVKLGPRAAASRLLIRFPTRVVSASLRPKLYDSSHLKFLNSSTSSGTLPLNPPTSRNVLMLCDDRRGPNSSSRRW
jgi:hypothetical protein